MTGLVLSCILVAAANVTTFAQTYYAYVASESADEVSLVSFDGKQARVEEVISVGRLPLENEGPHGMTIAPDHSHWFVTIAHGFPYGRLCKYTTEDNRKVKCVELGMFPASMEISAVTNLLYAVNFNLHGDPEPSTVSVVDPEAMTVVAEIPTSIMPHGSRISPDGTRQYHVSMMTDELMEINTLTLEVTRRLDVAAPSAESSRPSESSTASTPIAKPTWADPHPSEPFVYVANNGSNEIVEVDRNDWATTRRFSTGSGPYNLEVTADGKYLVASYKGDGTTGVWNLETGKEAAVIPNSRSVTHGVVTSPDSRYAFISVEGKGGEPGSVDVIDLQTMERVGVAEVGKQAGGIVFWKQEK
jgi:DNA-binding beta-propeller fold protein YncE